MKSVAARTIRDESTQDALLTPFEREEAEREEMAHTQHRCLGKGVVAGLIGGLVGTIVMSEFQKAWSKASQALQCEEGKQQSQAPQESENATMKAAGKLARLGGKELSHQQKKTFGQVVHYLFGTAQGGLYGGVTELARNPGGFLPAVLFGAALFGLADEVGVPALGLSGKPSEYPISSHLYGMSAHIVYGMTTEIARRGLRAAI